MKCIDHTKMQGLDPAGYGEFLRSTEYSTLLDFKSFSFKETEVISHCFSPHLFIFAPKNCKYDMYLYASSRNMS